MKTTMKRINFGDPIVISPWFRQLIKSLPPVKEVPLTKEQWAQLSPTVKQMIRKGQVLFSTSQGYSNPLT